MDQYLVSDGTFYFHCYNWLILPSLSSGYNSILGNFSNWWRISRTFRDVAKILTIFFDFSMTCFSDFNRCIQILLFTSSRPSRQDVVWGYIPVSLTSSSWLSCIVSHEDFCLFALIPCRYQWLASGFCLVLPGQTAAQAFLGYSRGLNDSPRLDYSRRIATFRRNQVP